MRIGTSLKRLVLPGDDWSLDVDLRYLPVARFLKQHAQGTTVLEVGSSSKGITPYIDEVVIGSDTFFPSDIASRLFPVIAKGALPFRDKSVDAVISLDTLEHVPREFRQLFIDELARIARRYVIIGFPEGNAAERHDAAMEEYFVRQNTEAHKFFVEHREYRIPKLEDLPIYFMTTRKNTGREFEVHRMNNVNIMLRGLFMRTIWNNNRTVQRVYSLLTALSRWDWMFHFGVCYRSIYFLTMSK